MSFGKKLLEARKRKGLSQEDIARHLNTKAPVIGRYERDEMKPSIEVASKLADLLDVTLDFLVGNTDYELDKSALKRILEISKFSDKDKEHIFVMIDAYIRDVKNKQAFGLAK
ncbi:MAG: helix-turn-helix transcriptional regulator [Patescibacteria group bacterium]